MSKNNTFIAFKELSRSNEKQPHFTGTINIDGEERRIAIWVKTSSSRDKFLTGEITIRDNLNEDLDF